MYVVCVRSWIPAPVSQINEQVDKCSYRRVRTSTQAFCTNTVQFVTVEITSTDDLVISTVTVFVLKELEWAEGISQKE